MKASTPVEGGTDFHGALAAASANRNASSNESRQLNPKEIQSPKSEIAAPKKKDATSTSSNSDTAAPPVFPAKPILSNIPLQTAVGLPVNDDAAKDTPSQAPDHVVSDLQGVPGKDATVADKTLASPSAKQSDLTGANASQDVALDTTVTSPASPAVATSESKDTPFKPPVVPSNGISVVQDIAYEAPASGTIATSERKDTPSKAAVVPSTTISAVQDIASEAPTSETKTTTAPGDVPSKAAVVPLTVISAVQDIASDAPSSRTFATHALGNMSYNASVAPATERSAVQDMPSEAPVGAQAADTLEVSDISDLAPALDSSDPISLAAQRTAAAVAQSIAVPATLPNFSTIGGIQISSESAAGKAPDITSVAAPVDGLPSRQTTLVFSKAKPTSEVRGKVANEKDGDGQAVSAPAASASAVRTPDTPAAMSHVMTESPIANNTANLQAIPQGLPADGLAHIAQTAQNAADITASAPQTAPIQVPSDSQAMSGITSAQLTQSMRSSEMKLGMQSTEFGNISISTSLNHQAISAQISIDHIELGRALAIHLPAIEEKLGSAYGVQAKVELRDSNNPASSNDSGYSNSGQQSREQRQSRGGESAAIQSSAFERVAIRTTFTATHTAASTSRLDIRV